jgi:hypothetical protein
MVASFAGGHFFGNGSTFLSQLSPNFSFAVLFTAYTCLAAVGSICFWFSKRLPKPTVVTVPIELYKCIARTFVDRRMLVLTPSIIAYGIK